MDAKISVIVPVYRVEKYLEVCVNSILAQTYPNLEIILVDDGSPDRSGEMCDEYVSRYPEKIRVIHKPNGGLSSARNAGLDEATGEYISFIDSDDKILPEMYSEMVEAMKKYNVDIVASDFLQWTGGRKVCVCKNKTFTGLSRRALSMCFNWKIDRSVVTKLYRRSVIGDLRFHVGLTNEDLPFICELYLKNVPIHVMDKGYYMYRNTTDSITTTFNASQFDVFTNLEYISNLIPKDNFKLRKDLERFTLQMHIMTAKNIVMSHKNTEYKKWLRRNRTFILKHFDKMTFDSKINYRWRLKAMLAFLRIP